MEQSPARRPRKATAGWLALAVGLYSAGMAGVGAAGGGAAATGPAGARAAGQPPAAEAAQVLNWALDRIDQRRLPLDGRATQVGTGEGITIYVIDTGVRLDHPEFAGRVHAAGNFGRSETIGTNVDDCAAPDGHGTLNASLAAGATVGVAPRARIEVLRATGETSCDGTPEATERAVNWITANGRTPAVVNLSFRFASPTLNEAIRRSIASGFVYTLSAGTAGDVTKYWGTALPAEALIVAGTDRNDLAMREDYGPALALFAPAVSVTGAGLRGAKGRAAQAGYWTPTREQSGDSYAAPLVAGAAALYLERRPKSTPREVREAIIATATEGVVRNPGRSANRLLFIGP